MRFFMLYFVAVVVLVATPNFVTSHRTLNDFLSDGVEGITDFVESLVRSDSIDICDDECSHTHLESPRSLDRRFSKSSNMPSVLLPLTIDDLCDTHYTSSSDIISECKFYLSTHGISVSNAALLNCSRAYIDRCLTPHQHIPQPGLTSSHPINVTFTFDVATDSNRLTTLGSFNPLIDENVVFIITNGTNAKRTDWTAIPSTLGEKTFELPTAIGNCTAGSHVITEHCVITVKSPSTHFTGLTYTKLPPVSRSEVIISKLTQAAPCVNWTQSHPEVFTEPPTETLTPDLPTASDPTAHTSGNLTHILQQQLLIRKLPLTDVHLFIADMIFNGWSHSGDSNNSFHYSTPFDFGGLHVSDIRQLTANQSLAVQKLFTSTRSLVIMNLWWFPYVPLTNMPDCRIDFLNLGYVHLTTGSANVETPSSASAYQLTYPTCTQYTTCGKEHYTSLGPSVDRKCWTMYCNETIVPGQQYPPLCMYDDAKGGVELKAPYSIFDMTTYGIFDWRYRRNSESGGVNGYTPNYVSYVNGVKDQAGCGSCWDFATTAVVESAFARAYNLGVDSALVLPQISKDGINGNHYFASDLSEQHVLDYSKPYDECNHGGGGIDTALPTFNDQGGVPLIKEWYPAMRNDTWMGVEGDHTYLGNQDGANNHAEDVYSSYRPYTWGGTNYYASAGKAQMTENEIRNRVKNEGPFVVYINACGAFGGYTGVGVANDYTCGRNYTDTSCNDPAHPEWCGAFLGIDHAVVVVGYGTQFVIGCVDYNYITIFGLKFPIGCNRYGPTPQNFWIVRNSWGFGYANPCFGAGCDPLFLSGGYVKFASGFNMGEIENEIHGVVPQLYDVSLLNGWIPWITPHNACFNVRNTNDRFGDVYAQIDCHAYMCSWNRTGIDGDRSNNINSILRDTWTALDAPPMMSFVPLSGYQFTLLDGSGKTIDYDWDAGGYCEDNKPKFCAAGFEYCTSVNSQGFKYNTPTGQWSNPLNIRDTLDIIAWIFTFGTGTLSPVSSSGTCWYWIRECNPDYPSFSFGGNTTVPPPSNPPRLYSLKISNTTTPISGNKAYTYTFYPNGTVASLSINSDDVATVARALYTVYGTDRLLDGTASYSNSQVVAPLASAVTPEGMASGKRQHRKLTIDIKSNTFKDTFNLDINANPDSICDTPTSTHHHHHHHNLLHRLFEAIEE
jgi:hypothetical protein